MKTHSNRLIACLITRKHWRHNGSRRTIKNVLGEKMPGAIVVSLGEKEARKGWTLRHDAKYHNAISAGASAATHSVGRKTVSDINAGWGGGLCAAKAREAWTRFEQGPPCQHNDNHTRFGVEELYNRLAFKRQWHERKVGGWSGRAFMLLSNPGQERTDYRGWSMGCPEWYAEHQP